MASMLPRIALLIAAMLRAVLALGVIPDVSGLVIMLDDAHWLDPLSCKLLEHVMVLVPRLVVLASCRSGLAKPSILRGLSTIGWLANRTENGSGNSSGKDPKTPRHRNNSSFGIRARVAAAEVAYAFPMMIVLGPLSRSAIGLVLRSRRHINVMDEEVLEFVFARARAVPGSCLDMFDQMLGNGIVEVDRSSGTLRRVRMLEEVDLLVSDCSKAEVLHAYENLPSRGQMLLELASIVGNEVRLD